MTNGFDVDSNGNGKNIMYSSQFTPNTVYNVTLDIYTLNDFKTNPDPLPTANKLLGTISTEHSCPYSDRSNMYDTYAQTCSSINIANGVISGNCLDYSRKGQNTSLKYCECNQTISNCGGTLVCGECPNDYISD